MGFLVDNGETYTYEESKQYQQRIKEAGIYQFLSLLKKNQSKKTELTGCNLIWGDEIEFMLINLNDQQQVARLQLNSKEVFEKFHSYPQEMKSNDNSVKNFETKYEYGSWMIETTPDAPFTTINNINELISNFQKRRNEISNLINKQDKLLYLSVFPMLGVGDYYTNGESKSNKSSSIGSLNEYYENQQFENIIISPNAFEAVDDYYFQQFMSEKEKLSTESLSLNEITSRNKNPFSDSIFTDDKIITQHQRFYTLTQNIRQRRGEKVDIQIPLFIDKNTKPESQSIYMDSMAFGMGNSCLQLTLSAKNISHCRFLYDQLAIISPLFLCLSGASPIYRGLLSEVDTRWDSICQSVDDRRKGERECGRDRQMGNKSRYESVSFYIAEPKECNSFRQEYNDIPFEVNQEIVEFARVKAEEMGVQIDENLLQHLGFLFARDALVVFKDRVNVIDDSTEHFENLQSTNWNSVRFKPPPSLESTLPWRVEFRTMDLQITDEENALLIYLVLAIALMFYQSEFGLNFYLPISLVDENFVRASKRNALMEQKFFFRKNVLNGSFFYELQLFKMFKLDGKPEIIQLSIRDFFFGNSEFIGIQELLFNYLQKYLPEDKKLVKQYQFLFDFLRERVEGKKLNTATWIRQFVLKHPNYKQDSIISETIAYDLLNTFEQIQSKSINDSNFLNFIPQF